MGGIISPYPPGATALATGTYFQPGNPTGTASTTGIMMGFGNAGSGGGNPTGAPVTYTPASTGRVKVTINGYAQTAVGGANVTISPRYNTTASNNGDAVTGTGFGGSPAVRGATVAANACFSFCAILALVAGTPYFFDLAINTGNAADAASIVSTLFVIEEVR